VEDTDPPDLDPESHPDSHLDSDLDPDLKPDSVHRGRGDIVASSDPDCNPDLDPESHPDFDLDSDLHFEPGSGLGASGDVEK